MLVIDDSKLKLLKMKEKMLELSPDKNEKTLAEYQKLAIDIDSECYKMIIDKIKSNNYHSLPFEEQVKFYNEIIEDYNYLNELQCRFKNEYAKYSSEELPLSLLSDIMIEDVKAKASQIEGYLVNIKNLKSNKIELDRLNQVLVHAVEEKKHVEDLMLEIRRRLKSDILNAKGRIQETNGSLEVTSINLELANCGIDLNAVIDDDSLLDEAYGAFKHDRDEARETLNIALSLPNRDDAICNMYMQELLKANYRFNLLELLKEAFDNNNDYNLFKDSLYKIEDLVKEIKNGLRELGIKYYINPFDYIKIKDYIAMFENVHDPQIVIDETKKTIAYLANMIDDMEKANNKFLLSVNDDITIVKEETPSVDDENTLYVNIDTFTDEETKDIDEILNDKEAKDNQVIRIHDLGEGFKKGRVKEKTRDVINRVYNMIKPKKQVEKVPELVIERKVSEPIQEEPKQVEPLSEVTEEPDLFQEIEPFEKPILFDDRSDSGIFDNEPAPISSNEQSVTNEKTINEENQEFTMPELFWVPKEEIEENHLRR